MATIPPILNEHIGPLPLWAVGGIVIGGVVILGRRRTTAQVAPPVAAANAPNPAMGTPTLLPAGASVYDPNTNQVSTAPSAFGGAFFSNLGHLFSGLANAPNAVSVTDPSGASISWSNGVPTYGNGAVQTAGSAGGLHSLQADQAYYDYYLGQSALGVQNYQNFLQYSLGSQQVNAQNYQTWLQGALANNQNNTNMWQNYWNTHPTMTGQNGGTPSPAPPCMAGTPNCSVG